MTEKDVLTKLERKHLIDKEQFVNNLVNARSVIKDICDFSHPNDNFEHPFVTIINAMIRMIYEQEEVKIE